MEEELTRNIGLLYISYVYFAYYIIYVFLLCVLLTQRSILVKFSLGYHTRALVSSWLAGG